MQLKYIINRAKKKKIKILFSCFPGDRRSTAVNAAKFRPLVLLIGAVLRRRIVWTIDGIIVTTDSPKQLVENMC